MNSPIRDMAGLREGTRAVQVAREISYQDIEHIGGLSSGTVAKYLGPKPSKRMGLLSTFLILQAMGKAILIVDDPEQLARIEKRFRPRIIKGGATLQLRRRDALLADALSIEENRREYMRELGRKGGKVGGSKGGKRRMETMSKRARQRAATHAARKRWSKAKG